MVIATKTDQIDLKALIAEKGEDWAVAAVVDGSIGYYDPAGAQRVVKMFMAGETKCYSERCMCCYGNDLEKMMRADLEYFLQREQHSPTQVAVVLEFVKSWAKVDEGPFSMTGLMYPSLGL